MCAHWSSGGGKPVRVGQDKWEDRAAVEYKLGISDLTDNAEKNRRIDSYSRLKLLEERMEYDGSILPLRQSQDRWLDAQGICGEEARNVWQEYDTARNISLHGGFRHYYYDAEGRVYDPFAAMKDENWTKEWLEGWLNGQGIVDFQKRKTWLKYYNTLIHPDHTEKNSNVALGEKVDILKNRTLKNLAVAVGWSVSQLALIRDIRFSLVLYGFNAEGYRAGSGYTLSENENISSDGAVKYFPGVAAEGDDEAVFFELDKISPEVSEFIIVAEVKAPAAALSRLRDVYVRLYDNDTAEEFLFYETRSASFSESMELARLYRRDGSWRFTMVFEPFSKGKRVRDYNPEQAAQRQQDRQEALLGYARSRQEWLDHTGIVNPAKRTAWLELEQRRNPYNRSPHGFYDARGNPFDPEKHIKSWSVRELESWLRSQGIEDFYKKKIWFKKYYADKTKRFEVLKNKNFSLRQRGERISLANAYPLVNRLLLALSWDLETEPQPETALYLSQEGQRAVPGEYVVSRTNPQSEGASYLGYSKIVYGFDDCYALDLTRLPAEITELLLVIRCPSPMKLRDLGRLSLSLLNADEDQELLRYRPDRELDSRREAELLRIYKKKGVWRCHILGVSPISMEVTRLSSSAKAQPVSSQASPAVKPSRSSASSARTGTDLKPLRLQHGIKRGERFELPDEPLYLGFGWKYRPGVNRESLEADMSVFMTDGSDRIPADEYFVFYNNLSSADGSVRFLQRRMASRGLESLFAVDLSRMNGQVEQLVFICTIHEALERRQNFSMLHDMFVTVFTHSDRVIGSYLLEDDIKKETALEFCRLYRRGGKWRFRAVGQGYNQGLQKFVDLYTV